MRLVVAGVLLPGLLLAGCAAQRPLLALGKPRTEAVVECAVPDFNAGSGEFLVSRACLSACLAHGFRPIPGSMTGRTGGDDTPGPCLN